MGIQFLVSLPQIKLNIVLTQLPDRVKRVPSYLPLDRVEYISQSTSKSSERISFLPSI